MVSPFRCLCAQEATEKPARDSLFDLHSFSSFTRYTVSVDGVPLEPKQKGHRREMAPLVKDLDPARVHHHNQIFAKLHRSTQGASLKQLEEKADSLIEQTRPLHPVYQAACMFNLMMITHDLGNTRKHNRVKAGFAQAPLAGHAKIPVGLCLRLLDQATFCELQTDVQNDVGWPQRRKEMAALWLQLMPFLSQQIDPNWKADDYPQLAQDSLVYEFPSGQDPHLIRDEEVRAAYQKAVRDHKTKVEDFRRQRALRDLVKRPGERLPRYLTLMYARTPVNHPELQSLIENSRLNSSIGRRIHVTVQRINRALPDGINTPLLLLEEAMGTVGPQGMPRLLELLEDRECLDFVRKDSVSGLAILSDFPERRIDPRHVPRALRLLSAVAKDNTEPDKLREFAAAWVPRFEQLAMDGR